MTELNVRVRIGPSPTGEPHVGTAYIALFNRAFAKKNGGQFVLRIEDTDQDRSRPEWEREIMEGLKWLGLDWDEGPDKGGPYGPYRQSERKEIYAEHVEKLLDGKHAYRCFCTKERLDEVRAEQRARKETSRYDRHCRDLSDEDVKAKLDEGLPYVVRMKMPIDGETTVKDKLRGDVVFDNQQIDDQILAKSDGFPTYHLANVVDDHLMKISHVIRAEEWINSTPKHVVLYEMFGWEPPVFVHMPLLRNQDKSKISKRKNPVSIMDYKSRGYLPEVVLNYLAMLGWTMPDEREVFTVDEFTENFTWERVSLGGPIFDLARLSWLNGKYIREKLDDETLLRHVKNTLFDDASLREIIPLLRERMDVPEEFVGKAGFFFTGDVDLKPEDIEVKNRSFKELRKILEKYVDVIDRQVDFSGEALEALSREFVEKHEWKTRELFMVLRLSVTGRKDTPPLFDTMAALGRAKVRRRLRNAIAVCKTGAQQANKKKK